MLSSALLALVGFALSANAAFFQIQSTSPTFFNAGIQGCVAAASNADGEPLVIHNCNTEDLANQNWNVTSWTITVGEGHPGVNFGPEQIRIFGDKCVDVTDGVVADGTKLQIWTCAEGNTNQLWTSVTDDTFQLANTNKCIDLTDGKINDGNVLQIWTCDSKNTNQKWTTTPNPDSSEVFHLESQVFSAPSGPYCIAAASDGDGAEVALVDCRNSAAFPHGNITWSVPVEPLTGQVKTFNNKCLDVPSGSTANGVKLQIWTCTDGNTNQLFKFHPGPSQLEWNGKGKCVDLTDGKLTDGNPIQMWDCAVPDNNPNQQWGRSSL